MRNKNNANTHSSSDRKLDRTISRYQNTAKSKKKIKKEKKKYKLFKESTHDLSQTSFLSLKETCLFDESS